MPYEPGRINEADHTYYYKAMWLGLPLSVLLLIGLQFEAAEFFCTLAGGYVSGSFIGLAWSWKYDEFMRDEVAVASGWALGFAGLALFAQIIPFARDYEPDAGTVLAIMAVFFHTAIYVCRIRNGAFSGDS